jgi:hypothetical protein
MPHELIVVLQKHHKALYTYLERFSIGKCTEKQNNVLFFCACTILCGFVCEDNFLYATSADYCQPLILEPT